MTFAEVSVLIVVSRPMPVAAETVSLPAVTLLAAPLPSRIAPPEDANVTVSPPAVITELTVILPLVLLITMSFPPPAETFPSVTVFVSLTNIPPPVVLAFNVPERWSPVGPLLCRYWTFAVRLAVVAVILIAEPSPSRIAPPAVTLKFPETVEVPRLMLLLSCSVTLFALVIPRVLKSFAALSSVMLPAPAARVVAPAPYNYRTHSDSRVRWL